MVVLTFNLIHSSFVGPHPFYVLVFLCAWRRNNSRSLGYNAESGNILHVFIIIKSIRILYR